MNSRSVAWRRRSGGFTLMECIIVIVVLAIAGTGIAAMQGNMFNGQAAVKDIQVRTRLMEECAEQVLAVRRFTTSNAYESVATSSFGTNQCGTVTALTGYTVPSVSFTDPYSGAACPLGRTCKMVTISQNGMTSISLLLVDY